MSSIAMWGPPSSGKTTFLAALSLALLNHRAGWNLSGANEGSEGELFRMTSALEGKRTFPPATQEIDDFSWVLDRNVPELIRNGWFKRDLSASRWESVDLALVDASGEIAGPDRYGSTGRSDLLTRLKDSRGIIYMFDPVREFERGDAYEHTYHLCSQLTRELRTDRAPDFTGKLPHYVAVCVTKFDEPRVYDTARQLGLLAFDEDAPGFPRVLDDDARELLTALCEVSKSQHGERVLLTLERFFWPERIRYFVTSSVGFRVDPATGRFDAADPQNLLPDKKAQANNRVRGPVHPINVAEPLLWLLGCVPAVSVAGTRP